MDFQLENARLHTKMRNMESELNHFKNHISKLTDHISKLTDEKQELKTKLQELYAKCNTLSQHRQNDQKKLETQKTEIDRLNLAKQESDQQQAKFKNDNTDLIVENEKIRNILQEAVVKLEDDANQLKESKRKIEQLSIDLESSLEIHRVNQKDRNKLWDDMMYYKNKVDFPAVSLDSQNRITKLEHQLKEEREEKGKLLLENSHLRGPIDPNGCGICFESLPFSRCLKKECNTCYHNTCIKRWFDEQRSRGKFKGMKCPGCTNETIKLGEDNLGLSG